MQESTQHICGILVIVSFSDTFCPHRPQRFRLIERHHKSRGNRGAADGDPASIMLEAIRAIGCDGVPGTTSLDANGQTQLPVEIEIGFVKGGEWATRE